MSLIGVMATDDDEPLASFVDMPTALAWGLQQFKGKPFVVRVPTPEEIDLPEFSRCSLSAKRMTPGDKPA